jgi:signal peptidase I
MVMKERVKTEIREWAKSIVIALILALLIRTFIIQAFKIPSGSMIPTFEIGDRIFVSKFIYGARLPFTNIRLPGLREPRRGDVIVFVSPETPKKDFVKRLVALEGETVEIKNGNILINGKETGAPALPKSNYYYNRGCYGTEGMAVTVPEGFYFTLGDNSANSRDSRYWGFVPKSNVIGKAILVYWPISRIQIIR